ncbi:MAG TPA: ABC transporter permease [Blastocatellia bacterium]|nr:ABC transporter permease [Blastocatellia bacterium]
MDTLNQDVRYAIRTLLKNPAFTAISVLVLALGIGANTAIFSITDQVLLRVLPVKDPKQLVILRSPGPMSGRVYSDGDNAASFSYPMYKEIRDRNNIFSGVLARFSIPLSIATDESTDRASGELVSGNYFEVLGVIPALGRVFTQDDETAPGASPIVVLSYGYWKRRFGSDPGVLNKTLIVNGMPMTVVGVSRAGFQGIQVGELPDVFIPMTMKAQVTPNWDGLKNHKDYWLSIIGRLKPGLSPSQAEEAIRPIYRQILEDVAPLTGPWSSQATERYLDKRIRLQDGSGGRGILQQSTKRPLLVLMGMVGLVLLIACANVANLLMARGAARQREIAIRMALGGSRLRLVRQFLVESLVLSVAGGAVALLITIWTLGALISSIPESIGAAGLSSRLDLRLLGFNFALSVCMGLLFGLIPAFRSTRLNLERTLREQGSSVSGGTSQVRFRKGLVVCQIILTAVLLVASGLFARSLNNLKETDLGLRPQNLLEFSVSPDLNGYKPQQCVSFFDQLKTRVAGLPGVQAASAAKISILTDSNASSTMTVEGYQPQEDENTSVLHNYIGADYFTTLGVPLMLGREFRLSDTADSPKVAIVNESFVRRFFGDRPAIGGHFGFGGGNNVKTDIEIVGVVKDSKHSSVRSELRPFAYFPYSQDKDLGQITFYLRSASDSTAIAPVLRSEVQKMDPNLPVYSLKTLQTQIDESLFADRFLTFLSTCFGFLAALLAAIGLYGVMAYSVTRRTREIGIRMALGASRGNVSWLVVREVVILTSVGLVVGLPAAYASALFAESLLYGVTAKDPIVYVVAAVLLAISILLGAFLPARKAARTEPMLALRYE